MKKKFIIMIGEAPTKERDAITEYLRDSKYAWWHWLSDSWLVVDTSGEASPLSLTKLIGELAPGVHRLVFEILGDGNWYGFGPIEKEKNMFTWLRETWD